MTEIHWCLILESRSVEIHWCSILESRQNKKIVENYIINIHCKVQNLLGRVHKVSYYRELSVILTHYPSQSNSKTTFPTHPNVTCNTKILRVMRSRHLTWRHSMTSIMWYQQILSHKGTRQHERYGHKHMMWNEHSETITVRQSRMRPRIENDTRIQTSNIPNWNLFPYQ